MVARQNKDKVKESLVEIVGLENVTDDSGALESYAHNDSFTPAMKPRLVARPANVNEVQHIVKLANETLTPLVPVSSGPPHFYGDTVPSVPGSVMLDLSRMQRILRIDRKNRMAVIEPGVTFAQLQPELAKEGLRVSTPLLPRANKSVIASLLERQPILIPKYNWSLPEPLRCLEIVWGKGETLWTGEAGSGTHSLEKQWERGLAQVDPKGPQETDWYRLVSGAQGSLGIATWASIKCEILPSTHRLHFIPAASLNELVDCAYELLRLRLGDEFLIVNNRTLSCMMGGSTAEIEKLRAKLPAWAILIGSAGRDILPEERVEVEEKDIRDICQKYRLEPVTSLSGVESRDVLATLLNPCTGPYWKLKYRGGCRDIFFLTTLDKTAQFVDNIYSIADSLEWPSSDIGVYIQPQHQGVSYHCEFNVYYNSADGAEATKAGKLFDLAGNGLIERGAFFSRPYGSWAEPAYRRDPQAAALLKDLKKIFDPNNILNPGKLCFPTNFKREA